MEIAALPPAESKRPSRPARVLVVDDDAAMRQLCSINLQLEGVHVLEATDGWVALAQARAEPPDLILTDVTMPGLDGFELAEELRRDRRTKHVPLIFVSGEAQTGHETRAKALGAFAYVTKPFDPAALIALVTDVLTRDPDGASPELEVC